MPKITPPSRPRHPFAPRTQAMALEPRILFDAALPAAAAEVQRFAESGPPAEDASAPATAGSDRSPANQPAQGKATQQIPQANKDLIFVDQGVGDWQSLLAQLPTGSEIVVLDPAGEPLARIADELEQRGGGFAALHLFSHGAAGRLELAGGQIDVARMGGAAAELTRIGEQLSPDADLLLYGCSVAAGDGGRQFIAALAAATGADVAASVDGTGAARLGGNWLLEAGTGAIEVRPLSLSAFGGLLSDTSPPTVTSTGPLSGRPRARRASDLPTGLNFWRSTPLPTTSTFSSATPSRMATRRSDCETAIKRVARCRASASRGASEASCAWRCSVPRRVMVTGTFSQRPSIVAA